MTPPSNAGGEGREVLARAYDEAHLPCVAADIRSGNEITWVREKVALAAINLALSARENADDRAPALVEAAVAEDSPPDEDWLADVIDDSLDMDWTGRVGAQAIIARWSQRHD